PSSPPRPCRAMKQRSKPSSFRACSGRWAGSKAWASTPWERRASNTPVPDIKDTSRSAEVPPNSTATLPSAAGAKGGEDMDEVLMAVSDFQQFDKAGRHPADGPGTHADHHIARARVLRDGFGQ